MTYESPDETVTATTRDDDMSLHKAPSDDAVQSRPSLPDGGRDGWLTVFGAFLALFCTFGQLNAFGTFQTWYAEHQLHDLSPSTISWIGSLQLWIFFFSVSLMWTCSSSADDSLTYHDLH